MSLKQMQILDSTEAVKQERPAPCARHCEANAFQIVIKNLKAQLAQRTWVGLTDDEQRDIAYSDINVWDWGELMDAVEAKLKEKNGV